MRPNHRVLSNRRRREDRRVNYIGHTGDPGGATWGALTGTKTTGEADYRGSTEAWSIVDDNAAGYEICQHSATTNGERVWTWQCKVKKDAIAKTTRFPLLRFQYTGGTADTIDFTFDTSTGEFQTPTSDPAVLHSSLTDLGDWWLFKVKIEDVNANNTAVNVQWFPSVGASSGLTSYSAAATGTIYVCDPILAPMDTYNSDCPTLDPVPTSGAIRV